MSKLRGYVNEFEPDEVAQQYNESKYLGLEEKRVQVVAELIEKHRKKAEYDRPETDEFTLLDIGCGHGGEARLLSKYFDRVIGIDSSSAQIAVASTFDNPGHVTFRCGAAESLPIVGGSVDVITGFGSVHFFDIEAFMKECKRVLKPRGIAFFYMDFLSAISSPDDAKFPTLADEVRQVCEKCFWIAEEMSHPHRHILDNYQDLYNSMNWENKRIYEKAIHVIADLESLRHYYLSIPFYTNLGCPSQNPMHQLFESVKKTWKTEDRGGNEIRVEALLRAFVITLM